MTSRNHELLLNHKGNDSNSSNNSNKPKKSNFFENSINLIQKTSPIHSDPLNPAYSVQNRDAQAEYLAIVKMTFKELHKRY